MLARVANLIREFRRHQNWVLDGGVDALIAGYRARGNTPRQRAGRLLYWHDTIAAALAEVNRLDERQQDFCKQNRMNPRDPSYIRTFGFEDFSEVRAVLEAARRKRGPKPGTQRRRRGRKK